MKLCLQDASPHKDLQETLEGQECNFRLKRSMCIPNVTDWENRTTENRTIFKN